MNKLKQFLTQAANANFAIGAFNIQNLETLQAVVDATTEYNSPAIIALSESALKYTEDYITALMQVAKRKNPALFLHLDHGKSFESCKKAIDMGFDSVMIDGSALPFKENIQLTKQVVDYAHKKHVLVEGELGQLLGKEDSLTNNTQFYTNPTQAKQFVNETGVDSLAISIGTSHGVYKNAFSSTLKIDILSAIEKEIPDTPLVLHGASAVEHELIETYKNSGGTIKKAGGINKESLIDAIQNHHIAKVNTDTDLRLAFSAGVRETLKNSEVFDPRIYLGKGKENSTLLIKEKIKSLLFSQNKREV